MRSSSAKLKNRDCVQIGFPTGGTRAGILYVNDVPETRPLPPEVRQEFESIHDLGIKDVVADGNVVRRIQLFECRKLR